MTTTDIKLVIAGGKTGGHLFPGIAVAEALRKQMPGAGLLFVGTDAPFEIRTLKRYGFAHKSIHAKPIKGGNVLHKIGSMGYLAVSLVQSLLLLRSFKPDFVLGVGGFSSFAVVLAARILAIPTAIQEQNAVPGITNRILSRFAGVIFTSFPGTKGLEDHPKTRCVGNPVRIANINKPDIPQGLRAFVPGRFTILVTGGSQGAKSINAAFTDALTLMDTRSQYNIIHQTGKSDETWVLKTYERMKLDVDAGAFFHAMPELQAKADLVIARAGAGTIAELAATGTAAVLVPFPHAADDHQTLNAKALEERGAALLIHDRDLTGPRLKKTIENLIHDDAKRNRMAANLKALAIPDADKKIAAHILTAAAGKG